MKYIRDLHDGDRVSDIYFVKNRISAVTKNGKAYETVELQDKTGTIDAKIWDLSAPGISDYDKMDYVEVFGEVVIFNNAPQLNIRRLRVCREGEYNQADYMPVSKRPMEEMEAELRGLIASVKAPHYKALLTHFFVDDQDFYGKFRKSSAAKSVHHGFIGGLMEHTLSVAKLCDYYTTVYPILKRDLLITAALCHDIGKVRELSPFPVNDYTDEGQLLGHIVMGSQMVGEAAEGIEGFPPEALRQLQHCILAHHGKLEFGSPKKPSLIEAVALNYADDTDAKLETFKEILESTDQVGWLGFNKWLENNISTTQE